MFAWWALHEGGAAPAAWYPGALRVPRRARGRGVARGLRRPGAAARVGDRRARRLHALELRSRSRGRRRAATRGTAPTARCSTSRSSRCSRCCRGGAGGRRCSWARSRSSRPRSGVGAGRARSPATAGARRAAGSRRRSATRTPAPALFLAAFWPAVMLAALPGGRGRRARGVLLAAGGVLLELVVLVPEPRVAAGGRRPRSSLALVLARERARLLLVLVRRRRGCAADAALPARRLRRARPGEAARAAAAVDRDRAVAPRGRSPPARLRRACRHAAGRAAASRSSWSPRWPSPGSAPAVARRGSGTRFAGGAGIGPLRLLARVLAAARRASDATAPAPTTSRTTMRASGGGARSRSIPTASSGGRWGRPGSSALRCSPVSSWRSCAARPALDRRRRAVAAALVAGGRLARARVDRLAVGAAGARRAGDGVPGDRRRAGATARRPARGARGRRHAAAALAAASYALPGAGRAGDRARGAGVGRGSRRRAPAARAGPHAEPAERPGRT